MKPGLSAVMPELAFAATKDTERFIKRIDLDESVSSPKGYDPVGESAGSGASLALGE